MSVERETFPGLLASGARVSGHVDNAYWRDMGTPLDLVHGSADLVRGVAPSAALPGPTGESLVLDGAEVDPDGARCSAARRSGADVHDRRGRPGRGLDAVRRRGGRRQARSCEHVGGRRRSAGRGGRRGARHGGRRPGRGRRALRAARAACGSGRTSCCPPHGVRFSPDVVGLRDPCRPGRRRRRGPRVAAAVLRRPGRGARPAAPRPRRPDLALRRTGRRVWRGRHDPGRAGDDPAVPAAPTAPSSCRRGDRARRGRWTGCPRCSARGDDPTGVRRPPPAGRRRAPAHARAAVRRHAAGVGRAGARGAGAEGHRHGGAPVVARSSCRRFGDPAPGPAPGGHARAADAGADPRRARLGVAPGGRRPRPAAGDPRLRGGGPPAGDGLHAGRRGGAGAAAPRARASACGPRPRWPSGPGATRTR